MERSHFAAQSAGRDLVRHVACGVVAAVVGCAAPDPSPPVDSSSAGWGAGFIPGSHAVGFRTIDIVRAAEGGVRALTLSIWYPAEAADELERVTIGELYALISAEGQLDEPRGASLERGFAAAMTGDSLALTMEAAREALSANTLAFADAPPAPGRFPLVVWGVRHATVVAQAPLSELLASHGFVVATVWSSDPPLAFLWEDGTTEEKEATIATHTGDLVHAISELRDEPFVDADRVVTMAWSYGGSTAARLALANPAVRAVVSLDANVLHDGPGTLDVPVVWLARPEAADPEFEESGTDGPWVTVSLLDLAHGNFNALEGWMPARYAATTVFPWSTGGQLGLDGYAALSRMALEAARWAVSDPTVPAATLADRLAEQAGGLRVEIAASP